MKFCSEEVFKAVFFVSWKCGERPKSHFGVILFLATSTWMCWQWHHAPTSPPSSLPPAPLCAQTSRPVSSHLGFHSLSHNNTQVLTVLVFCFPAPSQYLCCLFFLGSHLSLLSLLFPLPVFFFSSLFVCEKQHGCFTTLVQTKPAFRLSIQLLIFPVSEPILPEDRIEIFKELMLWASGPGALLKIFIFTVWTGCSVKQVSAASSCI